MHIEIAVDAMELAEKVYQIVLFSSDGDFPGAASSCKPITQALAKRHVQRIGREAKLIYY
jgi:uncharacterized LabA/DUF88 family protein